MRVCVRERERERLKGMCELRGCVSQGEVKGEEEGGTNKCVAIDCRRYPKD